MTENTFTLRKVKGIPFYSCRSFEKLPGLFHGFSIRHGDASDPLPHSFNLGHTSWDSVERIDTNRHRFLSALNPIAIPLITLRQIHSNRVHIIKEIPDQGNPLEGDALITCVGNVTLGVQTADCLPVLIADPENNVIAAVHSGWRGTLQEIAVHTIRSMQNSFRCNPANLLIAVGPGIRSCCFEVGSEVSERFEDTFPATGVTTPASGRPGKFLLNLTRALESQLHRAGIRPENIYDLGLCTCCNTDTFFSYRAEGADSGRMMAVIGRTSKTGT